jgi:hypothetical protein
MRIFATSVRDTADTFLHAGYISAAGHTQDRLTEHGDLASAMGEIQRAAPVNEVATAAAAPVTEVVSAPAQVAVTEVANESIVMGAEEAVNAGWAAALVELFFTMGWWVPGLVFGLVVALGIAVMWPPRLVATHDVDDAVL